MHKAKEKMATGEEKEPLECKYLLVRIVVHKNI